MRFRRKISSFSAAALVVVGLSVVAPVATPMASAGESPIQSVTPARLADTRLGEPTIDGRFAGMGRRSAGSRTEIKIAGRGNVPLNASAVLLNLTDVQLTYGDNFLTVFPCTSRVPNASNLNTPANDIRANNVFVKLSSSGTVCVYSEHVSNFIIDVSGYVPVDGSTATVSPARVFDSRRGNATTDGRFAGGGRLAAGSTTEIRIAGRAGVPDDAQTAIINVTDVLPLDGNYLTVYPCTDEPPEASSLNTAAGDIRANNLYAELSDGGTVCVYTVRNTDLVIDVSGYVPAGGTPVTVYPARLLDSRPGGTTVDEMDAAIGRVGDQSTTEIQVAGRGNVSSDATEAVINLTSVLPTRGNYLTVYPCGTTRPNVSNLNSPVNDVRANTAFVKLSAMGTVCVYSVYATDLVVDVYAYSVTPPIPLRLAGNLCENYERILGSVHYADDSLDGKSSSAFPNFEPIGGVAPYSFEASGLTGYTLNKQTGQLARTSGTNGTVNFTMSVSDAKGAKLTVPASVTWSPTQFIRLDYQAYLPNGQTVVGPQIVNWGSPPFTYSLVGPTDLKINPTTGAVTYVRTGATNSALEAGIEATITLTDQAGSKLAVRTLISGANSWVVSVPSGKPIGLGDPIGTFNTDGWGKAPFAYALSGADSGAFGINSAGQLSVTNAAYLQDINRWLTTPGLGTRAYLTLTVTGADGARLVVPVQVDIGHLGPPVIDC